MTPERPAHIRGMTATTHQARHINGRFAPDRRPPAPGDLQAPINPWAYCNFIAPDQAGTWREAGFQPYVADTWAREHFGALEALRWSTFGATPATARAWVNLGFTPDTARDWLEGFQPAPDPLEGMVRYDDEGVYGPIDQRTALHV